MRRRWRIGFLVAAAMLSGCTPAVTASPSTKSEDVPETLRALPTTTVRIDERSLRVAVAETIEARRRGLMAVDDLGPLDGLLFSYAAPTDASFHMRGVPIPLDIAFFDAEGRLLEVLRMAVCEAEPCPSYAAPAPIRWAIETEAGGLSGVAAGARLSLEP